VKITSELGEVQAFVPIPRGVYLAHISGAEFKKSAAGNLMMVLEWVIDEGSFLNRHIKFDHVMLGGKTKDGSSMPLFKLCDVLESAEIPWKCEDCSSDKDYLVQPFYTGKGQEKDGLPAGRKVCPNCKSLKPTVAFEDTSVAGSRCLIKVTIEKQEGSDKENNKIEGYLPLSN
jgi:hypothetical protein